MGYQNYTPKPGTSGFNKKPSTEAGRFDKKADHPQTRASIAISVAMNNVVGGLSLDEILSLATDEAKFGAVTTVIEKLVGLQLDMVGPVADRFKPLT